MRRIALIVSTIVAVGCADDDPNPNPNNQQAANNVVDEGGREKPVVIDPCTAATAQVVSDAFGVAATQDDESYLDDSTGSCALTTEMSGTLRLDVARQSNAADNRGAWEDLTADTTIEMADVSWSPDGELRIQSDPERADTATLWAMVINTDYVNRDVYVRMDVSPHTELDPMTGVTTYSALPIETQRAALLSIGEVLSDAIRAAQPDGVILPEL